MNRHHFTLKGSEGVMKGSSLPLTVGDNIQYLINPFVQFKIFLHHLLSFLNELSTTPNHLLILL